MFSMKEKQHIAKEIERVLLELKHPEMPANKPNFKLLVDGKEDWSWAEIEPNWTFKNREPSINEHNERVGRRNENKKIF